MDTTPARVRLEVSRDPSAWDAVAREKPGGTAFHRSDFLDLQERMLGIRIDRLVVVDDAGGHIGIVPLARRSAHSPRAPWLPFPLLGPAVDAEAVPAVLRAVRRWQRRHGLLLARFDVAPALASTVLEDAAGARMLARVDGTVHVDLRAGSIEAIDAAMDPSRRKRVRQAFRAGVTVRAAEPGEVAAMLGPMLDEAFAGTGRTNPYPPEAGRLIEAWATDRPDVGLLSAFVGDDHVGVQVVVAGHSAAAAWMGSCLHRSRSTHAESALLRNAVIWAMQQGSTTFEFGGRVSDSIERFKRSFGGTAVPYLTVESLVGPARLRDVVRHRSNRSTAAAPPASAGTP